MDAEPFDDDPREDENGVSLDQEPLARPVSAVKPTSAENAQVPWVKFFPDRYTADVADCTTAETAGFFRLLMHQMRLGALPEDETRLRRIARLSPKEWTESRDALSEKFGPNWRHEQLARDRDAAVEAVRQRSEAGRSSAEKRAANLRAAS
jgi:uncharacterized protein YdaU (DUF1376 family)